jgi:acetyltransferase-like isoleucine patch superfamily enzyme
LSDEIAIARGTPESREMVARINRAIVLSERLSALSYADGDAIRSAWAELTGRAVDETFRLVPPFHSDCGVNISVGRNVFINQGCTLSDIGGIDIGDDVMLGPGVRLITSGHPVDPAARRSGITAAPIRIEDNVWIAAGAHVLQGVTVGRDAVVAAGAVVTRDVEPATLVAGVPARLVRRLEPAASAAPSGNRA